jgi:hypothetical protein
VGLSMYLLPLLGSGIHITAEMRNFGAVVSYAVRVMSEESRQESGRRPEPSDSKIWS